MFNIGAGEFLVIALIALIVLGPQRLPAAARQAGKAMGELRRLSTGFQNELKEAFSESNLAAEPTPRRNALADTNKTDTTVTSAVAAVSQQPVARRTPLKAAPAEKVPSKAAPLPRAAAAKKPSPPKKAAGKKTAPVAKASRPPSRG